MVASPIIIPVATAAPHGSLALADVGEILSRIGRGEAPCGDGELPPDIQKLLRKRCVDRCKHFQNEIARALEAGRTGTARKKFNKMLRNTSVRLAALMEANEKHTRAAVVKAEREQRDTSNIVPLPFGELCALLPDIDIFGRAACGHFGFVKKSDGEYRPIVSFGLADRACGILLKHALTPFARAHPQYRCHEGQYMLAGGAHIACGNLIEALEEAPPEAVFIQIDVKRFYEHISIEGLGQLTGLSQHIIRGGVSAGDLVRRGAYREWEANRSLFTRPIEVNLATAGSADAGSVVTTADRCIAPGSAVSSIVGEMVMGHTLRDVCARAQSQLPGQLFR